MIPTTQSPVATAERDLTKLPHDPFKAIVAPRPIGWISTRALDGRINLAPYSFFNGFSSAPPIVGFSSEGWKDSASFAKESGEFVANLATHDLRGPMNETSAPLARGDNEFARAGLTMAKCRLVAAPRVAESPAALECKVVDVIEIKSASGALTGAVLTLGEFFFRLRKPQVVFRDGVMMRANFVAGRRLGEFHALSHARAISLRPGQRI